MGIEIEIINQLPDAEALTGNELLELEQESKSVKEDIDTLVAYFETALVIPGVIPIGAIIAWHKSMAGVPALDDSFLECDGSIINDVDSPMNGETLPDLNGDLAFIRGGAVSSNVKQDDTLQGHWHTRPAAGQFLIGGGAGVPSGAGSNTTSNDTGSPSTDGINGVPRTSAETRPVNMTMVWIMRIK